MAHKRGDYFSMTRLFSAIAMTLAIFIAYKVYTPPSYILEGWQNNTPAVTWFADGESGGLGTGWIYDLDDGIIITNNHVIDGADEGAVEVVFAGADEALKATVVGGAPKLDIAVLKVDPEELNTIPGLFELSVTTASLGDTVYAIGHPHGQFGSVSRGIISYDKRVAPQTPRQLLVQTDTAINSGNSGGPLLNRWGQLVGVNVSILSQSGENNGLGFAVHPISLAKAIEEIVKYGKTTRPLLGVGFDDNGDITISDDGAAAKAGLVDGDIILKLDDTLVAGPEDILVFMASRSVGDVVAITTERGVFHVTLEAEDEIDALGTSVFENNNFTDEELDELKEAMDIIVGESVGVGVIKSVDIRNDSAHLAITVTEPLEEGYESHAQAGACTLPLGMITARVGFTFTYEDEDGKELDVFEFDKATCEDLQ